MAVSVVVAVLCAILHVMHLAAPYDVLAGEYYDDAHITSRNFDATTRAAIAAIQPRIPAGLVLEPGCGRGRSHEFLQIDPLNVVQLDNSQAMLSVQPREAACLRVLHDAERLPFPDGEFSAVIALLCDPFLGLNFLREARRVLVAGGLLFGTTPSYEWGTTLRESLGIDPMETRFKLRGGAEAVVPSALYPVGQLREMLTMVGFIGVDIQTHRLPVTETEVSPDIVSPAAIRAVDPHNLDILHTFTASA